MAQETVAGAPRTPLPFGLFSVVPFRANSADRWRAGVQYESIGCLTPLKGVGFDCNEPEESIGLPKNFDEGGLSLTEAEPFVIYETYRCSPIGNSIEIAQATARTRLEAREEIRVEQALSTGAFGQSPNFADANAVTELDAADSLRTAIAELEQVIATEYGAQGILHMSRYTATLALERGLIESGNNRLRTKLGTPVVAGGGYTFEGIYATPSMFGYRGDILETTIGGLDMLNRQNNNLHGLAERPYLLAMDECGFWHINFTP